MATYYIDIAMGSDSNDGLTQSTPWRTLKNVAKGHPDGNLAYGFPLSATPILNPGDYVLLKREGVWRETLYAGNTGVFLNMLRFAAYGRDSKGNENDQVIEHTRNISGWATLPSTSNLLEISPTIFRDKDEFPNFRVVLDNRGDFVPCTNEKLYVEFRAPIDSKLTIQSAFIGEQFLHVGTVGGQTLTFTWDMYSATMQSFDFGLTTIWSNRISTAIPNTVRFDVGAGYFIGSQKESPGDLISDGDWCVKDSENSKDRTLFVYATSNPSVYYTGILIDYDSFTIAPIFPWYETCYTEIFPKEVRRTNALTYALDNTKTYVLSYSVGPVSDIIPTTPGKSAFRFEGAGHSAGDNGYDPAFNYSFDSFEPMGLSAVICEGDLSNVWRTYVGSKPNSVTFDGFGVEKDGLEYLTSLTNWHYKNGYVYTYSTVDPSTIYVSILIDGVPAGAWAAATDTIRFSLFGTGEGAEAGSFADANVRSIIPNDLPLDGTDVRVEVRASNTSTDIDSLYIGIRDKGDMPSMKASSITSLQFDGSDSISLNGDATYWTDWAPFDFRKDNFHVISAGIGTNGNLRAFPRGFDTYIRDFSSTNAGNAAALYGYDLYEKTGFCIRRIEVRTNYTNVWRLNDRIAYNPTEIIFNAVSGNQKNSLSELSNDKDWCIVNSRIYVYCESNPDTKYSNILLRYSRSNRPIIKASNLVSGSDSTNIWTSFSSTPQSAIALLNTTYGPIGGARVIRSVLKDIDTGFTPISRNGKRIRFRFDATAATSLVILNAFVGEYAGIGEEYNMKDGTATRIQFSGSNSVTVPAGGVVYSDWVSLSVTPNFIPVLSISVPGGFAFQKGDKGNLYYKLGDAANVGEEEVSGYTELCRGSVCTEIVVSDVASAVYRTSSAEPSVVFFNNERGKRKAFIYDVLEPLDWAWYDDYLYVYAATSPDALYTSPGIEAAERDSCVYFKGATREYMVLRELIFAHAPTGLICDDVTSTSIEDCEFSDCFDSIKISNSTITLKRLDIEGHPFSRHGIWISEGNSSIIIDDCDISSHKSGVFIRPKSTDLTGLRLSYNAIHHNEIGVNSFGFDSPQIYENIIYDNYIAMDLDYDAYYNNTGNYGSTNASILNNVFGCINSYCMDLLRIGKFSSSNTFQNNIFYMLAKGIRRLIAITEIGSYFSYNCHYATTFERRFEWIGNTYSSLETFQTATNQETGAIGLDPLFDDAASYDFRVAYNSPCLDAGISTTIRLDYYGNNIPIGTGYEIGVNERKATQDLTDAPITDAFKLLPLHTQYLDAEQQDNALREFLAVFQPTLDEYEALIDDLWKFHSIDNIPEPFFRYLGELVGFDLRFDVGISRQRQILKDFIFWARRRGTKRSFDQVFREIGVVANVFNNAYYLLWYDGRWANQENNVVRTSENIAAVHRTDYVSGVRHRDYFLDWTGDTTRDVDNERLITMSGFATPGNNAEFEVIEVMVTNGIKVFVDSAYSLVNEIEGPNTITSESGSSTYVSAFSNENCFFDSGGNVLTEIPDTGFFNITGFANAANNSDTNQDLEFVAILQSSAAAFTLTASPVVFPKPSRIVITDTGSNTGTTITFVGQDQDGNAQTVAATINGATTILQDYLWHQISSATADAAFTNLKLGLWDTPFKADTVEVKETRKLLIERNPLVTEFPGTSISLSTNIQGWDTEYGYMEDGGFYHEGSLSANVRVIDENFSYDDLVSMLSQITPAGYKLWLTLIFSRLMDAGADFKITAQTIPHIQNTFDAWLENPVDFGPAIPNELALYVNWGAPFKDWGSEWFAFSDKGLFDIEENLRAQRSVKVTPTTAPAHSEILLQRANYTWPDMDSLNETPNLDSLSAEHDSVDFPVSNLASSNPMEPFMTTSVGGTAGFSWLQMDCSSSPLQLRALRLLVGNLPELFPTAMELYTSNDGSTWTSLTELPIATEYMTTDAVTVNGQFLNDLSGWTINTPSAATHVWWNRLQLYFSASATITLSQQTNADTETGYYVITARIISIDSGIRVRLKAGSAAATMDYYEGNWHDSTGLVIGHFFKSNTELHTILEVYSGSSNVTVVFDYFEIKPLLKWEWFQWLFDNASSFNYYKIEMQHPFSVSPNPLIAYQDNSTNDQSLNTVSTNQRVGQAFYAKENSIIDSVTVYLKRTGATPASGSIYIDIYNSAPLIPNVVIATSDPIDVTTIPIGGYNAYTFDLHSVSIVKDTKYWFVIRPTYSQSAGNTIVIGYTTSPWESGYNMVAYTPWSTVSWSLQFSIFSEFSVVTSSQIQIADMHIFEKNN